MSPLLPLCTYVCIYHSVYLFLAPFSSALPQGYPQLSNAASSDYVLSQGYYMMMLHNIINLVFLLSLLASSTKSKQVPLSSLGSTHYMY